MAFYRFDQNETCENDWECDKNFGSFVMVEADDANEANFRITKLGIKPSEECKCGDEYHHPMFEFVDEYDKHDEPKCGILSPNYTGEVWFDNWESPGYIFYKDGSIDVFRYKSEEDRNKEKENRT